MFFPFLINNRNALCLIIMALIVVMLIYPAACSNASDALSDSEKRLMIEKLYSGYKTEFPDVMDITPQKAMELAQQKKVIFIDVRDPGEQQVSMIANAITDKHYQKNPEKYKDYIKIGYCTISYRSGIFVKLLQKKGVQAYNLQGGILAWTHDGGKVYRQSKETNRIHVYGSQWNLGPDHYEAVW